MTVRVCIAGVTGWAGSAVARGVLSSGEFELVGAVARTAAGGRLGARLEGVESDLVVAGRVGKALERATDVLIDYTHPSAVKGHILTALQRGVAVVVGTSGLDSHDFEEIEGVARDAGVGVVAAGNFSVTAALLKHFSGIAARHVPHWEILDMAGAGKPDAPSGTARELAEYLGEIAQNELEVPIADTLGARDARGASIGSAQVHALRLPGYVLAVESIFGLPGERLTIRHDAGASAEPYVGGTLLAAKAVLETVGLIRGLDTLLFSSPAA